MLLWCYARSLELLSHQHIVPFDTSICIRLSHDQVEESCLTYHIMTMDPKGAMLGNVKFISEIVSRRDGTIIKVDQQLFVLGKDKNRRDFTTE